MTVLEIILAAAICGVLTLTAYLHLLYVESVRFRPRHTARSFDFFEQELRGLLGLEPEDGLRRYAIARQISIVLLTLDMMLLALRNQGTLLAILEALFLSLIGMIVFAHILPSILFSHTRGAWAVRIVPLARLLAWGVRPLLLLTGFASSVAELGAEPLPEKRASGPSGDIDVLLDVGQEEGLIGEEDRKLIQSVVEFGDKTVREAMTPRPEIVALEANRTVEELRQLMIEEEFSRVPIYEGAIDNVVGYVHSRDALEIDEAARRETSLRELLRPLPLVPETKPINSLLREMQDRNVHMAIVIDEYGQTAGLVTLEDLMEEIVGEIRDESEPERDVVEQPDRSFVVSGKLDLDRLEELVGFRPDEEFETTTIGGLVCEHLGQVPSPGAKMQLDGIEIEVLAADARRVKSVRVRRLPPGEERPPIDRLQAEKSPGPDEALP